MTSHPSQRGVTLVSLLVGLLVALFVILSLLATYRSVIRSIFGSAPGTGDGMVAKARLDGDLSSAILSAQLALQDAGFGITGASANNEFIALSEAALSSRSGGTLSGSAQPLAAAAVSATAVVWASNPALASDKTQYRCQALLWSPGADSLGGELRLLTAQGNCQPLASRWNAVQWTAQTLIPAEVNAHGVSLVAQNGVSCWPFGAVPKSISGYDPPSAKLKLTLGFQFSTHGTDGSSPRQTLEVCLANFQS